MKKLITILASMLFTTSYAMSPLDEALLELINKNNLKAIKPLARKNHSLIRLGGQLFAERLLSGDKDITCMHCHHGRLGTSDNLPFSIGTGGKGLGQSRVQDGIAGVVKRNSPTILNLGHADVTTMFWDGRVEVDKKSGVFISPSADLNKNEKIKQTLNSALATQAIFPLLSNVEMLGHDNEIARLDSDTMKWDALLARLLNGEKRELYRSLFKEAYPKEFSNDTINIGHVGNAIAEFEKYTFQITDTPYDEYLRGDHNAMTVSQKKGLKLFLGKADCIKCHNGQHLTDFDYKSVGTPQIGTNKLENMNDRGRFEVTGLKKDQFKFRTPPLRNLLTSAPYMHSGAFYTIEEVVEHYNNSKKSLHEYQVPKKIQDLYEEEIIVDKDPMRNKLRHILISEDSVRIGLKLTETEKKDLTNFLKKGLLSRRFFNIDEEL